LREAKEKGATRFPSTAAPGVGNTDKVDGIATNDNLSLEDKIVKQTVHCSTVDFFWEQGTDPVISIEGHRHEEGEDGKEITVENAQIRFSYGNYTEIEISMPKQDLKKLVIAATRFLKDGQAACFQKFHDEDTGEITDDFKIGGFGSDLKFPTEKILNRYPF
jgi:hypothetical protein